MHDYASTGIYLYDKCDILIDRLTLLFTLMANSKIKLAIVGVGKIVHDQHLPAIRKSDAYELVATASRNAVVDGVAGFQNIESMLMAQPDIQAVALCMPPQYRYAAARFALARGVNVLLEKPPGATVCEVEQLAALADENDCRLYTTWHSRHGAAVEQAKGVLSDPELEIETVSIHWKEDVRKWHPGQEWIWQAGGLGVFDPGINGLSILTHILPTDFYVDRAELQFPSNKAAPIAATIDFKTPNGVTVTGEFDWRVDGGEQWRIDVQTTKGVMTLSDGGAKLSMDGTEQAVPKHSEHGEYEAIYAKFEQVIKTKTSAVDLQPLKLVADAFLLGNRQIVEAFTD